MRGLGKQRQVEFTLLWLDGIPIGVCKNVLSCSKINDRYFAFPLKYCTFASDFRQSHFEPVLKKKHIFNNYIFREPLSHKDISKKFQTWNIFVFICHGKECLSIMAKKKRAQSQVRECLPTSRRVWNWNGINLSFPLSSMYWEACSFCTCSFEPKQLRESTVSLQSAPYKIREL